MTDKFKEFLIEQNAFDSYIKYNTGDSEFNFDWEETQEGFDYWHDLYSLWSYSVNRITIKIYVYHYCILSNSVTYNTGFVDRRNKITSASEADDFRKSICAECNLNPSECSLISLTIVGERDEPNE